MEKGGASAFTRPGFTNFIGLVPAGLVADAGSDTRPARHLPHHRCHPPAGRRAHNSYRCLIRDGV